MRRTFGQFTTDKPTGALRPIRFSQMALRDTNTGDKRRLEDEGGGVRELPRTIFAQFAQMGGHSGSVPIGSLQEVTFEDDEIKSITGRGWLADMPHVRDVFVPLIASKTLFHNSVDLAEVELKIKWKSDDPADGEDFWTIESFNFVKWNIAATTLVGVPAFPDARVTLDEVTAALVDSDSELECLLDMANVTYRIEGFDEVTASFSDEATVPWADFHIPEAATKTAITVDEHGRIFGHLAAWGECHTGFDDRCVLAPRPANYASFNGPKVLTERGLVECGPIFFLGGHPDHPLDPNDPRSRDKAYGDVANQWGNVRVTDGQIGPWISGRVTPGLSANALYVARGSRISGHWKRGELRAIVSCNVDGFNMPGSELAASMDGAIIRDGEVAELVASLRMPRPDPGPPPAPVTETTIRLGDESMTLNGTSLSADTLATLVAERIREAGAAINDTLTTLADEDDDEDFLVDLALDELDDMDGELPMSDLASKHSH
jgi:hypothetical protein